MRRGQGDGGGDVLPCLLQGLPGQGVHQVEVEVVEIGVGDVDGTVRFVVVMDAAQGVQVAFVEALDADREAVDAAVAIGLEFFGFEGTGVGFHGDFDATIERQERAEVGQQAVQPFGRKQARGAAADEDGVDLAAPDQRQRAFEIGLERVEVFGFGETVVGFVRVEVAIGALAYAPGDVHVERERRQRRERDGAGLEEGGGGFGGRG